MDEPMNTGFPIPPSRPMFGEGDVEIEKKPLPESDFIMAFANETGDKAVVLTSVEVVDGEVLEKHGREELEGYAMDLLDGGEDELGLQIGDIYEGENAEADAKEEAFRLDDKTILQDTLKGVGYHYLVFRANVYVPAVFQFIGIVGNVLFGTDQFQRKRLFTVHEIKGIAFTFTEFLVYNYFYFPVVIKIRSDQTVVHLDTYLVKMPDISVVIFDGSV